MEEKNINNIYLDRKYLRIKADEILNFTIFPEDYILEHCGFIKSFENLNLTVKLHPEGYGIIKTTCSINGIVTAYEIDSSKTNEVTIFDSIDLILSDDEEICEYELNKDGNYDLLGIALCLLYSADLDIHLNY